MRERSLGDKWFGMPAVELTQDMKRDLKVLKMRDSLDPKRFYRKSESSLNPKYIQVTKALSHFANFVIRKNWCMDCAIDWYSSRGCRRVLLGTNTQT